MQLSSPYSFPYVFFNVFSDQISMQYFDKKRVFSFDKIDSI